MELETQQSSTWSQRSESIAKLAEALSKTQASVEAVKKDASNPFFKSKYADLASVWASIREALTSNGLSVLQEPASEGNKVKITTTLMHSSGEYVRSTLEVTAAKADPQGIGSAITYARRYALGAIVGIAPEDDDGNAASQGKPEPKQNNKALQSLKTADQVQAERSDLPAHKQKVGFGKHAAKTWEELSNEYLTWLVDKGDNAFRLKALDELDRRNNMDEVFDGDNISLNESEAA